ncbi:MAG: hypothetical protein QY325_07665 [Flavobacteriales bacterium]|nr:MAG: hypothetical protein QY325_07665 [Flavobacteriales bacterium]
MPRSLASRLTLAAFLATALPGMAQRGVTTVGIQVKPVLALDYFEPMVSAEREHLRFEAALQGGIAYGMSVRIGLTDMLSLETGLGQIQRRYRFRTVNDTSGYDGSESFRYVGYELPVTALVYLRLGQRTWMNTALGASLDFYPSDVEAVTQESGIYVFRRNWAQAGILGNIGFEYRSERSGYFYLGATYHQPFSDMALADFTWSYFGPPAIRRFNAQAGLSGTYLTMDLRYYFHEDPDRRRLRRER